MAEEYGFEGYDYGGETYVEGDAAVFNQEVNYNFYGGGEGEGEESSSPMEQLADSMMDRIAEQVVDSAVESIRNRMNNNNNSNNNSNNVINQAPSSQPASPAQQVNHVQSVPSAHPAASAPPAPPEEAVSPNVTTHTEVPSQSVPVDSANPTLLNPAATATSAEPTRMVVVSTTTTTTRTYANPDHKQATNQAQATATVQSVPPAVPVMAAPPVPVASTPAPAPAKQHVAVGRTAQNIYCPICKRDNVTITRDKVDGITIVMVIVLLLFFWPLFWLPLVIPTCKTTEHSCSGCYNKVGEAAPCT